MLASACTRSVPGSDCAVFSAAYAIELVVGNPSGLEAAIDVSRTRLHLEKARCSRPAVVSSNDEEKRTSQTDYYCKSRRRRTRCCSVDNRKAHSRVTVTVMDVLVTVNCSPILRVLCIMQSELITGSIARSAKRQYLRFFAPQ